MERFAVHAVHAFLVICVLMFLIVRNLQLCPKDVMYWPTKCQVILSIIEISIQNKIILCTFLPNFLTKYVFFLVPAIPNLGSKPQPKMKPKAKAKPAKEIAGNYHEVQTLNQGNILYKYVNDSVNK